MRKHDLKATNLDIGPADFPIGSPESRAVARALIERRSQPETGTEKPLIFRAPRLPLRDEVIYDYQTGLPIERISATQIPETQQRDEGLYSDNDFEGEEQL